MPTLASEEDGSREPGTHPQPSSGCAVHTAAFFILTGFHCLRQVILESIQAFTVGREEMLATAGVFRF